MPLEFMIPVAIVLIVAMIPIVALLTSHQQKMAQIIHKAKPDELSKSTVARLEAQVDVLRDALMQQTLALDSLTDEVRRSTLAPAGAVRDRLQEPRNT
jgi:hypothetical protein